MKKIAIAMFCLASISLSAAEKPTNTQSFESGLHQFTPTDNKIGYFIHGPNDICNQWALFSKGKRVVDAGCGDGYWTLEALRQGAKKVFAIDKCQSHIHKTQETTKLYYTQVTYHHESIMDIDLPIDSVDAILFCHVLAYLSPAEIKELILNTKNWLKPGGKIFIVTTSINTEGNEQFNACKKEYEEKIVANPLSFVAINFHKYMEQTKNILPEWHSLTSPRSLSMMLQDWGFEVEACHDITIGIRSKFCGAIAVKPN
ncbi:MAG: methyltransferase domain-containing protein [Epsilonproteobacteria bacterium]|nr:methyltransferase domain-containing protein [Campylobacterota bacterium]